MNQPSLQIRLRNYYRSRLPKVMMELTQERLTSSAIVFSPHQDDETLGCGGTILQTKQAGGTVKIAFMTDGSGSHSHLMPESKLVSLRQQEALAAAKVLGLQTEDVFFLGFKDGELTQQRERAISKVREILQQERPTAVYIPYFRETHPDHFGTNQIVTAALKEYEEKVTVYEYPVWYWHHWPWTRITGGRQEKISLSKIALKAWLGWQIFREFDCYVKIDRVKKRKRDALMQHRTQVERLVDDPNWGILSDVSDGEWLDCFFQPYEIFRSFVY
ncbi:PIG-L deacetylase family protein [Myxosarcina sp. GI1]|uniref:PIG-L deacetylase family protein n=1 Tax=Myxosarcina sp. GI1 TaxID=1541065 RepID=UPI00055EA69D|nr:PIG-L family deacetylase [Myxosarcina sp. GI1]